MRWSRGFLGILVACCVIHVYFLQPQHPQPHSRLQALVVQHHQPLDSALIHRLPNSSESAPLRQPSAAAPMPSAGTLTRRPPAAASNAAADDSGAASALAPAETGAGCWLLFGIPTMPRPGTNYLNLTLGSLLCQLPARSSSRRVCVAVYSVRSATSAAFRSAAAALAGHPDVFFLAAEEQGADASLGRTRRQTVDVARMLLRLEPLAKLFAFMEDDWLLCEGGAARRRDASAVTDGSPGARRTRRARRDARTALRDTQGVAVRGVSAVGGPALLVRPQRHTGPVGRFARARRLSSPPRGRGEAGPRTAAGEARCD